MIGSNIIEEPILKHREAVRVPDNSSTGPRENLAPFLKDGESQTAGRLAELIKGGLRFLDRLRFALSSLGSTSSFASTSFASPRPGDVKHSLHSVVVLHEKLGVRKRVSLDEGPARLVEVAENEAQCLGTDRKSVV